MSVSQTPPPDAPIEKDEKPFKMPMTWMKAGAPPEKPLQHAFLGFSWMIILVCSKFMQAAGFEFWTIIFSQVALACLIILIAFWEDFFPRQKKKVGKVGSGALLHIPRLFTGPTQCSPLQMAPNLGRIEYVEGERLTIPTDKVSCAKAL